jgi:hypothetical protein
MGTEFVIHILFLVFATIVVVGAAVFVVVDMFGRVDYLKDRAPWLEKVLERKGAVGLLLIVAIFLLVGNGLELVQKEVPEVAAVPPIIVKAPLPPQIVSGPTPRKEPRLRIEDKNGPLNGRTIYMDEQGNLNFPDPLWLKNIGNLNTQTVSIRVSFSEVVALTVRQKWDSTGTGNDDFPFELWIGGPVVVDVGDRWWLPTLAGKRAIQSDKPIVVKVRAFCGTEEPSQAVFRLEKPKPRPSPAQ